MTECDDDVLVLGPQPGEMRFDIIRGDAWADTRLLKENGVPIAWPEAPVIRFVDQDPDLEITATLTAYTDPDDVEFPDALATWTMTAEQVALLEDYNDVRIRVDEETWFRGVVSCLF